MKFKFLKLNLYVPISNSKSKYEYWPIRVGWYKAQCKSAGWFKAPRGIHCHGWQVGWEVDYKPGVNRRVFGWTLHLFRLQIYFGANKKIKVPTWGKGKRKIQI